MEKSEGQGLGEQHEAPEDPRVGQELKTFASAVGVGQGRSGLHPCLGGPFPPDSLKALFRT